MTGSTSAPDERSPADALHSLLVELFDADELRRWLAFGPEGEQIELALPGKSTSMDELTAAAIGILKRRGLLDEPFFQRLRAARPRHAAVIERVRSRYFGTDHRERRGLAVAAAVAALACLIGLAFLVFQRYIPPPQELGPSSVDEEPPSFQPSTVLALLPTESCGCPAPISPSPAETKTPRKPGVHAENTTTRPDPPARGHMDVIRELALSCPLQPRDSLVLKISASGKISPTRDTSEAMGCLRRALGAPEVRAALSRADLPSVKIRFTPELPPEETP